MCAVLVSCRSHTCANGGEEEQPEETKNGSSHHLGDGTRVDLLVQFGRQVGVVHVVSIHQMFEQHVHQTCNGVTATAVSFRSCSDDAQFE